MIVCLKELKQRLSFTVRGSSSQAREGLKRHFSELQTAVTRLLTERLSVLLSEVDVIEQDSVRPLDDCQKLIEHGVSTADELLREARHFTLTDPMVTLAVTPLPGE
uniref:Uncharacterized protein n=1 Tax=Hucho hucho TaxID=62062 RepID=A0A4W5LGY0_9TELE